VRSRAVGAFFLALLAWLLAAATAGAQATSLQPAPVPAVGAADSLAAGADSTRGPVPAATDSLGGTRKHRVLAERDTVLVGPLAPTWQRQKSPRRAMIASFLIPGLGQLYNERPFWAAVAAGVEFYFLGSWVVEQRLTNRYRARYNADPSDTDAQVLYELHRDSRIQAQWLLGLTIAISGLQSYVDASLSDFDNSPLPLRLGPDFAPGRAGMSLQWRF
jgi:hypothetical protein